MRDDELSTGGPGPAEGAAGSAAPETTVTDDDALAERFEHHRSRLRAVAFRMLSSSAEAEDAVQEAWLRLSRTGADEVDNLAGWLTTVVARVCLDMLRSRESRREEPWEAHAPQGPPAGHGQARGQVPDPEQEAMLADSVGVALLVVLDTLAPAERLAFVLHDLFGVPFDEIAPIVERSPAATRQLASRARRRVRGAPGAPETDVGRQREVVDAFLAASRGGDFEALLTLLDPDAVLRVDAAVARAGGEPAQGADAVARVFAGRAKAAQPALVNGSAALVWVVEGTPRVVFGITVRDGRVVSIDMVGAPERIADLDVEMLPAA